MFILTFNFIGFHILLLNLPQIVCSLPTSAENEKVLHIPNSQQSAILARRILRLSSIGTISTIFPSSFASKLNSDQQLKEILSIDEHRPKEVDNTPIGLVEYIADCEDSGNPTVLAISIATTFKNAAAGSNVSLSLSWTLPYTLTPPHKCPECQISGFSAAILPRFSLTGYLERIKDTEIDNISVKKCFLKAHPDAKFWTPGNQIHASEWNRLVVQHVYWIGGFGDRAYIGWIPVDLWRNVSSKQIDHARLPGEDKK